MAGGAPLRRSLWTAHALDGLQRADHAFAFPRDHTAGRCRVPVQLCSRALLTQRDAVVVLQDCPHCGVCGSLCSIVPAAIPPGAAFASRRVCLPPECPVVREARAAQFPGAAGDNATGDPDYGPSGARGRLKWRPPPPGSCGLALLPTSPPAQDAASVVLHLVIPAAESARTWQEGMHAHQRAIAAACFGLVLAGGALVSIPPSCGVSVRFAQVTSTIPSTSCVRVTMHTRVTLQGVVREDTVSPCPLAARQGAARAPLPAAAPRAPTAATYDATDTLSDSASGAVGEVAGCDAALDQLHEMVLLPLLARRDGGGPDGAALLAGHVPAGLLLHGPPGTGKTAMVRSTARRALALGLRLRLFAINGSELLRHQGEGEAEAALREVFAVASAHSDAGADASSIVFVDEIDALCPKRDGDDGSGFSARIVAQLLTLLSGGRSRGRVLVVGATNRPHALDEALRRPGRLDREIAVDPPGVEAREAILQLHLAGVPLTETARSTLPALARDCVGFVGADVAALVREAVLRAGRRPRGADSPAPGEEGEGGGASAAWAAVDACDLAEARAAVVPSALRAHTRNVAGTTWGDVGGLAAVKQELRQAVEWPLFRASLCRRLGVVAPRGILLHGPPGCSKTTLARAAAGATHAAFYTVSGAEVYSAFVGEAEATIRDLFRAARATRPAILFFDEIDALVGRRDMEGGGGDGGSAVQSRVLSTFLNEMDGVEMAEGVLVVAATNRPDLLDAALLRPGRFDKLIHVPLPDLEARAAIIRVHTRKMPLAADVDVDALARAAEGLSGADIEAVCREAAMDALRGDLEATEVSQSALAHAFAVRSVGPNAEEVAQPARCE